MNCVMKKFVIFCFMAVLTKNVYTPVLVESSKKFRCGAHILSKTSICENTEGVALRTYFVLLFYFYALFKNFGNSVEENCRLGTGCKTLGEKFARVITRKQAHTAHCRNGSFCIVSDACCIGKFVGKIKIFIIVQFSIIIQNTVYHCCHIFTGNICRRVKYFSRFFILQSSCFLQRR